MRYDDGFSYSHHHHTGFIRVLLKILLGLLIPIVAITVLSIALNTTPNLITQNVTVTGLSNGCDGFTILHISDLNGQYFGEDQAQLGSVVSGKTYKAVVLTGDMLGENGDASAVVALAKQLKSGVPIFYIPGDHDGAAVDPSLDTVYTPAVLAMKEAGITYLDAPVALSYGGQKVWFVPEYQYTLDLENLRSNCAMQEQNAAQLGDTPQARTLLRAAAYYRDLADRIEAAKKAVAAGDALIALTHVPLDWDEVRSAVRNRDKTNLFSLPNTALVLSGHRTGGSARLPFLGAVYVKELGFFPEDENVVGLWNEAGINQYISPGLANGKQYVLPIRIMNRPSVTILKLVRSVF